MSRSRLAILGTVSVFTLLAATGASQALTPPPAMNLGLLRPQAQWTVGTVEAAKGGAPYCAMVGKFDKKVVLAFARSKDGFGSIAIDYREKFFEPGAEYEVILRPDSGKVRSLVGRASSERSVVVQVGRDDALYKTLSANGTLGVGLPSITSSFRLGGFDSAYKGLVNCASHLPGETAAADDEAPSPPAVKVAEVERDALDAAAAGEARAAQEKIAALDARMQELEAKIAAEKAAAVPPPADHNRKLLASTQGGIVAAPVPAPARVVIHDDGVSAAGGGDRPKTASLQLAVDNYQKQIDTLAEEKKARAGQSVEAFNKKDAALRAGIAKAEEKRARAEAGLKDNAGDKALKAGLVSAQGEIAGLNRRRDAQTDALAQDLSGTHADYEARIAALEAERDDLKQQLAAAIAAGGRADALAGQLRQAQDERDALQRERDDLQGRLAAVHATGREADELARKLDEVQKAHQAKVVALQAERDDLRQQLAAAGGAPLELAQAQEAQKERLAQAQAERDALRRQLEARAGDETMSARLAQAEKTYGEKIATLEAERDDLRRQLDVAQAGGEEAGTLAKKLAQVQEEYGSRLAAVEAERDDLKARLAQAQPVHADADRIIAAAQEQEMLLIRESQAKLHGVRTELEETKKENKGLLARIAALQERLAGGGDDAARGGALAGLEAELAQVRAERDAAARQAQEAQRALADARREIGELKRAAASGASLAFADESALLPSERAELEEYRRNARAVTSAVPVAQAAPDAAFAPLAAVQPPRRKPLGSAGAVDMAADLSAPPDPAPAALGAVEPAAGAPAIAPPSAPARVLRKDEIEWDEFLPSGYNRAAPAPAPVAVEKEAAAENAMPSVPAVPPAIVEMTPPAPDRASGNRAAAFLERIMSFHRPRNEGAQAATATAPALVAEPPASVQAPALAQMPAAASTLADIQPAAGVAAPVTLKAALAAAGIGDVVMGEPETVERGVTVQHWTAGGLNGMHEQMAAAPDFDGAVQSYLDRYREDCPGKLQSRVEPARGTRAGEIAVANIACTMENNAYTTSFVFLQDDDTFSGILHTGYPGDEDAVRAAARNVAQTLAASGGLAAGGKQSAVTRTLQIDIPPQPPLAAQVAPAASGDDDFETVVVR